MSQSRRNPKPLDPARLEELALAYVARFATTKAKLRSYLDRKVRERGWDSESRPQIAELAEKFESNGFIDDAAFARAKTGSLLRRGYGMRRVSQALYGAGVEQEAGEVAPVSERDRREAALTLARKRRFGPFKAEPLDRSAREKQIAAMLRAGHALDDVLMLVDAASAEAAEDWAAQGEEDQ